MTTQYSAATQHIAEEYIVHKASKCGHDSSTKCGHEQGYGLLNLEESAHQKNTSKLCEKPFIRVP